MNISQKKEQPLNSKINKVLYGRVSSLDQSLNRQQENLDEYDIVIEDKVSGAVPFFERQGGKQILKMIEDGVKFQLYVSHVDRCGRNVLDILSMINFCTIHGIGIIFYRQGLRTLTEDLREDPVGRLIIQVLLSISEMPTHTSILAQYIFHDINKLQGLKKKKEVRNDLLSTNAPPDICLTNQELDFLRFFKDIVEEEQSG